MAAQTRTAEPAVVNGINVDDLVALIEGVKREPAKGITNWHVTTTWQGQARSRAEIESYEIGGEKVPRRFSIDIDEPRELGGSFRQSAGALDRGAQRLHDGRIRGAVRGARKAWRSRPAARSTSAASSGSILAFCRATRTSATPSASRVTAQRSSSPRSTRR